jgi:hypothetical protein
MTNFTATPVLMVCCDTRYANVAATVDHVCEDTPSWPSVDQDANPSVLALWERELLGLTTDDDYEPTGDDSDVLADWGTLTPLITEARGWMWDCGVPRPNSYSVKAVMIYIETRYDGGLGAFALHNAML